MSAENQIQCPACGAGVGKDYIEKNLTKFRGHKLCGFCVGRWVKLEVWVNREVSYQEMLKGIKR